MVYKFSDKMSKGCGANIPLEFNEQLAKELHKRIIRNFKKRAVYSRLKDNIFFDGGWFSWYAINKQI